MSQRNPFVFELTDPQNQRAHVFLAPCTVTQVSPLLVTVEGGTDVPGVSIAGATYSLGPANALMVDGRASKPIILPIGP
ncbi:hypothetical protein ACRAWB_01900 [Leifsonia poae]|uniref:hypothetical protein n=1 Tax=Leifsonia poae TaxID=110933 RepID=UPI003D68F211